MYFVIIFLFIIRIIINVIQKLWGPNDLWARPIYPGRIQRPKPRKAMAQAEEGYGPSSIIYNTRQPWDTAEDNSVLGRLKVTPKRRGKNGIRLSLKENLKYLGKAALTTIQCSVPDRAEFFGFYNHPQRLWVWTDGTSISFGKFKPTRGRRAADTDQYKRKNK